MSGQRLSRQPYNGWPTWATWNLVLWSTNDEDVFRAVKHTLERMRKHGRKFSATTAKRLAKQLFLFGTPDMAPSYMGDVRWRKVAEAWNEL